MLLVSVVMCPSSSTIAPMLPEEPGGRSRDNLAFFLIFPPSVASPAPPGSGLVFVWGAGGVVWWLTVGGLVGVGCVSGLCGEVVISDGVGCGLWVFVTVVPP